MFSRIIANLVLLLTATAVSAVAASNVAAKPYMGWTSWNLEALNGAAYGPDWQTAANMRAQSDLMHKLLQPYGYNYINVDSGWSYGYDRYGRPTPDLKKFPGGVAALAKYVHRYGEKLGIYWVPGVQRNVYNSNPAIYGTRYHIRDIVAKPFADGNAFGGNWHLKIDFRKPGAQEYIDSVVRLMASWGVDYLKLDGVGPGSDSAVDDRADVEAYANAIKKCGRPIWLELSWRLDHRYAGVWKQYADGRRVNDDVASIDTHFSDWAHVQVRFAEAPAWTADAGPGKGWNDFDAACVGDGSIDGLTDDERRTVMSFWAIECAPLYIGDDLSHLDAFGRELLTNREVIALDQAGLPAVQMVGGAQQVWRTDNGDGTVTVDLVNLGADTVTATANLGFLGFSGPQPVHDLWTHKDLGTYRGLYTTVLGPHASKLIRIGRGREKGAVRKEARGTEEGEALSAVDGIRPIPSGHAGVISVDFNGGAIPMDTDEIAGVVPATHWNCGTARTGDLDLFDSSGNNTGARLIYVAGGTYLGSIPDRPGNDRMMCGYLETYGHDTTTLTVTSLPRSVTRHGYDVYVYCKGANGASTRVARYTVGPTSLIGTNTANSDFDGTFKSGPAGDDDYVEFRDLTAGSFTLKATPVSSTDQYLRASINGIQIVAR